MTESNCHQFISFNSPINFILYFEYPFTMTVLFYIRLHKNS